MPLASRCQESFEPVTRYKGRLLYEQGKAQFAHPINASGEMISVGEQRVAVAWAEATSNGQVLAYCNCDEENSTHLCEHMWAAILCLDRRHGPGFLPGSEPLVVRTLWQGFMDLSPDLDDELDATEPTDALRTALARGVAGEQSKATSPAQPTAWSKRLDRISDLLSQRAAVETTHVRRPVRSRIVRYLLNIDESLRSGKLAVGFLQQQAKKNGEPGIPKEFKVTEADIEEVETTEDRELLHLIYDPRGDYGHQYNFGAYYNSYQRRAGGGYVREELYDYILPKLCATGRFGWAEGDDLRNVMHPLVWEAAPAWRFELFVTPDDDDRNWRIDGRLRRGEEVRVWSDVLCLFQNGLIVFRDRVAPLEHDDAFGWIQQLRQHGPISVPKKQGDDLLSRLWSMPILPQVALPPELKFEQLRVPPRPRAMIKPLRFGKPDQLTGELAFEYGGRIVPFKSALAGIADQQQRLVYLRDREAENAAFDRLVAAGAEPVTGAFLAEQGDVVLHRRKLANLVAELSREGWHIEAEGHKMRQAGNFDMVVTSGVDWFELDTTFDFDGLTAGLPELLAALRRGDNFIALSDGSRGMLPDEWLKKYAPLADLGETQDGKLRFRRTQAALLDALLAAKPDASIDEGFSLWREKLRSFSGITASDQPPTFAGQLREYQRDGLGWLEFLNEYNFGGCLADDMGLGKTIQVLALLEKRRTRTLAEGEQRRPSLVVVPKSLVRNWVQEAARFAPQMRVLEYIGTTRAEYREKLDDYDLIVTTYGTMRLDVPLLRERAFDYAILDESQAIKNADSQAAKASRLIESNYRLAMTGTPIENHLGELWSLFEFLNPGMLGRSSAMKLFTAAGREKQEGAIELLAQSLRPFLLRRTKKQVLKELPDKTEQTLYCELEADQRKLYNELRDHYRALLSNKIKLQGLQKSKIHVLEALLRLRQAACHPGLLDKDRIDEPSAKLETLLEQLAEIREEGHKALVFSQFTSLLAIVRRRLDADKIPYEYLDGKTTQRQDRVDRFQNDPDIPLFLISLKAGGLGLNLTAADYVYILDPWWNPAVEAQAVDRAHRIGQTKPVFAYRLIARGTVEEKILELQGNKKQLAEAIISADNSLIRSLTTEDLNMLLS